MELIQIAGFGKAGARRGRSKRMNTGRYLTACRDDGASVAGGDRARVPWWSFSKTVLAVAA